MTVAATRTRIQCVPVRTSAPWVQCAIPRVIDGQIPLGVRVRTRPANKVRALQLVAEDDNQLLRVFLDPETKGDLKIDVDTIVAFAHRKPVRLRKGKLRPREKLDAAISPFLDAAPGIHPGHSRIREIAAR